ncbi:MULTISPECIES: hypothetical protein [Crateriforma]|uniref:DUF4405 domain-containing protein n=1 Tax=Crateriforma conspicua TaxID=2527996 RepID=A0A5C6FYL5_9PLAN|nr:MULTISPECIES: hypothetical protein [Crateriforma]TWU66390.1 hypothetical protein V7x_19560 [Crateriforma conspicua]
MNTPPQFQARQVMQSRLVTIIAFAVAAVVILLTITSLPSLSSDHLGGSMLMAHMAASGALVFGLPLLAVVGFSKMVHPTTSNRRQRFGFWLVLITGWVTIATVFACMLPLFGTEAMHELMWIHGIAGFAMVPAVAVLCFGLVWIRKESNRSSNPG